MLEVLDASLHQNNEQLYIEEFKGLLGKIVLCFYKMLKDNVKLENNENKIRDLLLNKYINNNEIRKEIGLTEFTFNPEVPEANTNGRPDIKIQPIKCSIEDTSAYYLIECKRLDDKNLDGKTGLNGEYVENGIKRFVSGTYSSYNRINGMIGFVVKQLNIQDNIENINSIIKNHYPELNTSQYLQREYFINNFNFHYSSIHIDSNKRNITLYHLMFDFSKNIV